MNQLSRRIFLATGLALPFAAQAQSRRDTLRIVLGGNVNSLDPMTLGATKDSTNFSLCTYDRLLASGRRPVPQGWMYDLGHIRGELAESFEVSADGKTIVFNLRRNATWHDGSPVTAEDIKWSLDRNVSGAGMAKAQIATGSLTDPDQFTILDTHRVQVTLPNPDRLALSNFCIPQGIMYQGTKARQHATASDPWAAAWLKDNVAGSGAYTVERYKPGESLVLKRNEAWKCGIDGALPFFGRIILQTVSESSTRASLIDRGDADFAIDLAVSDVIALKKGGRVKVISMPTPAGMGIIAMNNRIPPFDNKLARQAVAAALPYEDLFQGALMGRGKPMFGATWTDGPPDGSYPQPFPLKTDLALARDKLARAGLPEGFKTSLNFAVSNAPVGDPLASLVQESLGKVGIAVEIRKLPDAQMAAAVLDKSLPMIFDPNVGALFESTDYAFRIFLSGNRRSNYACFENPRVDALIAKARFERDQAVYDDLAKQMVAIVADETPMVVLWQQDIDAVMGKDIEGYSLKEIRQEDPRDLRRA
jgi:peptide/nickel transport system substrate-binding protein